MAIDPARVKALFQAAIERDDPVERRAFLDVEVGDDAELNARLAALLAAFDQPPAILDLPLGDTTGGPATALRLARRLRRSLLPREQ